MRRVDDLGGAVAAIEAGFYQQQIQDSAYRHQRLVEAGERVIVGVNSVHRDVATRRCAILRIDAELEAAQIERLRAMRALARRRRCRQRALDALRARRARAPTICCR